MGSVYAIENLESGRIYIGSTTRTPRRRWIEHRSMLNRGAHRNAHLQAAWNKYGKNAFEFGVLEHMGNPRKLYLAEQFWMDVYREEGTDLYNFGHAAINPMLGQTHTEEARRKISAANKGKIISERARALMSKARKGKPFSEEHNRRISEARIGRCWLTKDGRARIAAARAKPYPAFCHVETDEVISPGTNLKALCRERSLDPACMRRVVNGVQHTHHGWTLYLPQSLVYVRR